MKNFDKGWSVWSKRTEKDYTNLPEGNYSFQIKARSNLGDESIITRYSFIVLPPWYKSIWAYVTYGLLFLGFNYLFYRWLKKKFIREKLKYEAEQKRLKYLHQLEMEKSEKEIIALKNEKLESEILGKNSELASVAMHLLQKGELLAKIREELVQLRKSTNDMPSEELKRLIRILNQESKMDKDWDQFAGYFDNTHSDFLKAIKETHPLLSAHELKLCAYLRMNLSSKEIAQLLNISVRGVEISRYRLRKKLQLPTEINLFNYFTEFPTPKKENIGNT
ncbi:MAG: transcriptional regulator [Mucilaginibacter sp.]|nr:transcriptional regulator [Mucilaginibacter sp.]